MKQALYKHLASKLDAYHNCFKSSNFEWMDKHEESIEKLTAEYMPSGSGIDSGTKFDMDSSKPNKLVFTFSYHHMDEYGGYDGWTEHKLIVTPSLAGEFDMRITGSNRNDVKEYFYQVFDYALRLVVDDTESTDEQS